MKRRSKARSWALQILYAGEVTGVADLISIADEHLREKRAGERGKEYTIRLINTVMDKLEAIDGIIIRTLTSWPIDRLSIIDKNILRIGTCELLYFSDIPRAVVIDEAIKLAGMYGGTESSKFINGVLDAIVKTEGKDECSTE